MHLKMNETNDDMLYMITKFLYTDEQYHFACTNKYNQKIVITIKPFIMDLPNNMDVIRRFMDDHYFNAWTKCPACKRQDCCSAKCLMVLDDEYKHGMMHYYY